jgi:hypothetical protein
MNQQWHEEQLITLVNGLDETEFTILGKLFRQALLSSPIRGLTKEGHLGFTLSPRQSALFVMSDLPVLLEKAGLGHLGHSVWSILDSPAGGRKSLVIRAVDFSLPPSPTTIKRRRVKRQRTP